MLTETTIHDLATTHLTAPVATLTINLKALATDDGEPIRLKNALSELNNVSLAQQINDLLDTPLPYAGVTIAMSTADSNGVYLPRASQVTTALSIRDTPDFVSILGEQQNQEFTVLSLNQDTYALYNWSKSEMVPITMADMPGSLTETLGTEKRGGALNFSTQAGQTSYHGHNETSQEKAIDQERYYREILAFLGQSETLQKTTFVLAGLSKNTQLFRKLNQKLNLYKAEIAKSVANLTPAELKKVVDEFVNEQVTNETEAQLQDAANHNTVVTIDDISLALTQGQVRSLYVNSKSKLEAEADDMVDSVNQLIQLALREGKTVSALTEENDSVPLVQATLYK
ncbi:baeRF6 domain-containing protein [Secundilactobacillus kimchicus]|uniref:baeRF6 domain-containing protein n=1 Tax=Secundilactobacillus kimchicus TaxID=528209 RepID=UPI0024A93669|nr:hypothetical protein [Secundilactobacillus kimchicus]